MAKETGKKPLSENNFVNAMLKSAEEKKEVKAQQRFDDVDVQNIDALMADIKKGKMRK